MCEYYREPEEPYIDYVRDTFRKDCTFFYAHTPLSCIEDYLKYIKYGKENESNLTWEISFFDELTVKENDNDITDFNEFCRRVGLRL